MNFHILSLFPDMVLAGISQSITGRALKQGKFHIEAVDIRDFSTDKNRRVDDYTYGGGAGMLMQAQPVYDAWKTVADSIKEKASDEPDASSYGRRVRTVYVTPQGKPFSQSMAEELSKEEDLIILCGHYEGIDERVLEEVVTDYVSIGDYVLTGGELAAMVIVDAVARLLPGVLHNDCSAETESFHGDLLEYPQYSRPPVWNKKEVPSVLLTGNQKEIDAWRLAEAVRRTRERRPDMYLNYERLQQVRTFLMTDKLLHIDMINAIDCQNAVLVHEKEGEVLLHDRRADIYYHTNLSKKKCHPFLRELQTEEIRYFAEHPCRCMVLHQEKFISRAKERFGLRRTITCAQAVYTRREKAPVTGLYRPDGMPMENGLVLRTLEPYHAEIAADACGRMEQAYIAERIAKREMTGAFAGETLAGFAGIHSDGKIGLLYVYPKFRGQKIAKALITSQINKKLERGQIPFAQVEQKSDAGISLAAGLGMYVSKTPVYRLEGK